MAGRVSRDEFAPDTHRHLCDDGTAVYWSGGSKLIPVNVDTDLIEQAFVSQYGTVFYISVGLGDKAFTYPLIASALTLVPVLGAMYLLDRIGRRPIYIFGGFFMGKSRAIIARGQSH
jgi:hypothetical protein